MLMYCWEVNLEPNMPKNGIEKVNLYLYAKMVLKGLNYTKLPNMVFQGWYLPIYECGIAMIEFIMSNEMVLKCLKYMTGNGGSWKD